MLNADFVKEITGLAQRANTNRIISIPGDSTQFVLLDGNGGHSIIEQRVIERNSVKDFGSIAKLYARYESYEDSPSIWYTSKSVVLLHAGEGSYDRSELVLPQSVPIIQIIAWSKVHMMEYKQVELYNLLRTTLSGCLPDTPNLRELVGRVDIKKAQEATGTVKTGGVSMSRSMVAEASGADKLPEVLTFRVPYWASFAMGLMVNIRVAFDLNPQTEMYRLSVLPGQIEAADEEAANTVYSYIRSELLECGVLVDADEDSEDKSPARIYHGTPS